MISGRSELDPKDFIITDKCGGIYGRISGEINGQQFLIQNCKVGLLHYLNWSPEFLHLPLRSLNDNHYWWLFRLYYRDRACKDLVDICLLTFQFFHKRLPTVYYSDCMPTISVEGLSWYTCFRGLFNRTYHWILHKFHFWSLSV